MIIKSNLKEGKKGEGKDSFVGGVLLEVGEVAPLVFFELVHFQLLIPP